MKPVMADKPELVFLGVGKIFRPLMQSYRFYSPDLSMKNFSRNAHTISIKFCPVILHPKVLLRAQWHQNRMYGI